MTYLGVAIVAFLFLQMFASMYFSMREEENRELLRENQKLKNEIEKLKSDNRILRARLGEQPGRAEY